MTTMAMSVVAGAVGGLDAERIAQTLRSKLASGNGIIIYLYWATSVEVLFLERNPNQGVRVGG
jgi:hypothetical protein